jgi:hypothetical protein
MSRESAERQAMVVSKYLDERLRARARAWMRRRNVAEEANHEVPSLLPTPPASNSGEASSASVIGTHSRGRAVAYWLMICASCRSNNEVGVPLSEEEHEFAVRCHACRALNKVSLDAGGEPLLVAEGLSEWADPSEPSSPPPVPKPPPQPPSLRVPSFYLKNSSTPADGDPQQYADFARKTILAAIPVVEKLKREREAVEAREARAAKRNTGARGPVERR